MNSSLVPYVLSSSVDSSELEGDGVLIETDYEVATSNSDLISSRKMVKIKQTAQKGEDYNTDREKQQQQGIPATFPHIGKPTSKAASHMVALNDEDDDDASSQGSGASRASGVPVVRYNRLFELGEGDML